MVTADGQVLLVVLAATAVVWILAALLARRP